MSGEAEELGITPQQLEAHVRRVEARQAADAKPLPGPLLGAIFPDPSFVAGLELRPMVASDLVVLEKLDSPLHRQLLGAGVEGSGDADGIGQFKYQDILDLLFVWSRTPVQVRAALSKGVEAFHELALIEIGDRVPIAQMPWAVDGLMAHFTRSFATTVDYRAAPSGDGTVFTTPPACPPTGSVGG